MNFAALTLALFGTPLTDPAVAVTVARALTDTFAGIRPADAPGFIFAQLAGLALALPLVRRPSPEGARE